MSDTDKIEELKKNTGKNIVFVEDTTRIDSAYNFSQYIFDGRRLLTLFGEDHVIPFECNKPSMRIADYCLRAVNANPKCSVMLEFGNYEPLPCDIYNCKVLFETFNLLVNDGKTSQIIPFDMRAYILTREVQNIMYGEIKSYLEYAKNHPSRLGIYIYVKPFYDFFGLDPTDPENINKDPDEKFLDKGMFSDIIYIYLTKYFMVEMTMRFNNIIKEIGHGKPLPDKPLTDKDIQNLLMKAWASVTNFFVLQILLNNKTDIDEYIILIGYKHIENIEGHLNNLNSISSSAGKPVVQLTKQIGNPRNHTCTSVYRSYRF